MNIKEELENIEDIHQECQKLAGIYDVKIKFQFNGRFSNRAGDARVITVKPPYGIVRFSKPLWPHATDKQKEQTIKHEIAHIWAEIQKPGSKHGKWWRRMFAKLNPPFGVKRLHSIDRSLVIDRLCFDCPWCGTSHLLSKRFKKRWIINNLRRCCRRCKGTLDIRSPLDAEEAAAYEIRLIMDDVKKSKR